MNRQPMVSVVMSVFNAGKYLRASVDSILAQSYTDFEFIIVDDGSGDSSWQILNGYKDDRIRLLKNEKNSGLVYSLNRGLDEARGKYIVRMDADDISLPDRLKSQVEYMESQQGIDVCGSFIQTFRDGDEIDEPCRRYPTDNAEIKGLMIFNCGFAHPAVIMRRDFLEKHGYRYREEYRHAEDYDLWCNMMERAHFGNIPEVLLKYRLTKGSVSCNNAQAQLARTTEIIQRNLCNLGMTADVVALMSKDTLSKLEWNAVMGMFYELEFLIKNSNEYDYEFFKSGLQIYKKRFAKKHYYLGTHILRFFSKEELPLRGASVHFVKHCILRR